jgi:endoglucanase
VSDRATAVFRRFVFALGVVLAVASPAFSASPMQAYVEAMQPGWNLGNTLDAIPTETSWGNDPATQELIQQIAAHGFKSIRLPVTWTDHTGPAPDYAIDPVWMDRVQQVVDWSLEAGLYVMINVHHDSWQWAKYMPTRRPEVRARFDSLWGQIADRFKDYPDHLHFESINEPQFEGVDDTTGWELLDELNTSFHRIVRASGGRNVTRPLVLPTLHTNAGQPHLDALDATLARLADPHLIATIHFYGYWPFSVNIAGSTRLDAPTINDIVTQIDAAHDTFVVKGVPVVVGEFGLIAFDTNMAAVERGEMLKFFEYFTHYARSKGLTHQWWDNGQHFDRAAGRWRDPHLYETIMRSLSGRSSTAESDLIFLRRGMPARDAALLLNLNGNRLVSLSDGAAELSPGIHYSSNHVALLVKAAALSGHASGALGEKTVLTAHFSDGPDWEIRVRHFDTPVLSAASGTKGGGLVIPTDFKGDLLATMEAVSGDGSNAGPHPWTSFKEFNQAYLPDYSADTITIKPAFFSAENSRTIDLTFHFWSGQIVRYRLSLKGNRVVGKPW